MLDGRRNGKIPTLRSRIDAKLESLGSSGQISVRFAALEEIPQAVAGLLERAVKLVHPLAIGSYSSRVHVSDNFEAQVRGAADSLGSQPQGEFSVISPVHLL